MNRDSIDVRLINTLRTKPPVALLTMLFAFNQDGQTKLNENFLGQMSTKAFLNKLHNHSKYYELSFAI